VIAGHFGLAALVKARERRAPLWALMLATVWLDVVFIPLLLLHLETLNPVPGARGGYGENVIHADYTHSLLGALLLAVIYGAVAARWWDRRVAAVLAAVVFSHWVLDLLVHRADMPILPGNAGGFPRLGFGLWRVPVAAAATEAMLVIAGSWFYWRAAREVAAADSPARLGRAHLAGLLAFLFGMLVLTLDVLS
jgi:membrane-bound metal-dependent hydrolase YbcI (DUF457 family)